MNVRETLCSAVRSRHIVEFSYDGHQRRVEPYVVWEATDDDWQLGGWSLGFSASESEPPWRCYNLSKIRDVTISNDTFLGNREGYNRNADRYENACCKL